MKDLHNLVFERSKEVVGKKAVIGLNVRNYNVDIEVIIKGFKMTYGRERYLVEPAAGKGKMWVENIKIA
jgi:hypothetical protein